MKFPENIAAIAKIMNAAGEKWTLSKKGREVVNFGFYEGSNERTKLFIQRIFDAAKELGVKKIVVTECGHAYDALRWTSYNLMEVPAGIEITHIVGVIGEFMRSGRIKLKEDAYSGGTITFHDACKIQRRGGHIQETAGRAQCHRQIQIQRDDTQPGRIRLLWWRWWRDRHQGSRSGSIRGV